MSGLESLYQELILDHSKRRVGFGLAEEEEVGGASAGMTAEEEDDGDEDVEVSVQGRTVSCGFWL